MNDEQIEGHSRNDRCDPDLRRVEPVLELTAVEQHLQRAYSNAQCHKAEEIEGLAVGVPRVADEDQDAEARYHSDRQVDVEDPAPAVILGQPTTEHRAKNRPQHDPNAPD